MKFFRVAVSGPTVDGREITDQDINDMAETYNPSTYGARIWMEHLRGLLPDSIFPAYGDVTALKAEDWTDPSTGKKKRALYAQLAPTPELIKANQSRQKIFFSIETIKNFAKTGKTYLGGLAVTDSPASLGTEMAAFSQQHREKFTGLPEGECLYSMGIEADKTELEPQQEDPQKQERTSLFAKVSTLLKGQRRADEDKFADITSAVELLADQVKAMSEKTPEQPDISAFTSKIDALGAKMEQLSSRIEAIESEPNPHQKQRPEATGGDGRAVTDC